MPLYEHECFIPLEKGATLWRYLDFEKFQSLLETKALFFCRADKFSDPFEGSIPKLEADYRLHAHKKAAAEDGDEFDEKLALDNILNLQGLHERIKRATTINCWHINNNESDAMWRLYLKDNEGVAIQTSIEKMYLVVSNTTEEIGLSKVRYLNYETEIWYHKEDYPHISYNTNTPLIHKRIEFTHESEFRLIHNVEEAINDENYWERQTNHKGEFIPLDIENLIQKVYLPPTVDSKITIKIEQMTKSLGYNFQFEKSKLSNKPLY